MYYAYFYWPGGSCSGIGSSPMASFPSALTLDFVFSLESFGVGGITAELARGGGCSSRRWSTSSELEGRLDGSGSIHLQ
jgi:hypothetical protein